MSPRVLTGGMTDEADTNEPDISSEPVDLPEPTAQAHSRTDPVAAAVLAQLVAAKPGGSVSPEDVARAIAEERRKVGDPPDFWRRYLLAVKQQAIHLARAGDIQVLRKGKCVEDPARARGVVRYRLPD